jgi:hypothetical protein
MERIYTNLPLILTILKIAGVVGAFYGLSEWKHTAKISKLTYLVSIAFLLVAIGAEVTDATIKRKEGYEMALRFERLARPLGTIKIWLRYSVKFSSPETDPYMQKLATASKNHSEFPPLPTSEEDPANDILKFVPRISFGFYSAGKTPSSDLDLSFWIDDMSARRRAARKRADAPGPNEPLLSWWKSASGIEYLNKRQFSFVSGSLESQIEDQNEPDNRYSDGEITSIVDMYGSTMEIGMCVSFPIIVGGKADTSNVTPSDADEPWVVVPVTGGHEIYPVVTLNSVIIEFPGMQEVELSQARFSKSSTTNNCDYYQYTFPKAKEEFEKLSPP